MTTDAFTSAFEKRRNLILLLLVFASTCLALPSLSWAEEVLRIGAAGSALGSTEVLGGAFAKSHRGVKVTVLPGLGTSGGITAGREFKPSR
jgi:ABC-type molybdate transport system substrate-binding protein